MMRSTIAFALFAGACGASLLATDVAVAGQATGELMVNATVISSCQIGGNAGGQLGNGLLDFGDHRLVEIVADIQGGNLTQPVKASMPLLCTATAASPLVSFGYGLHATGKRRNLQGPGGDLIPYELLRGDNPNAGLWDEEAYPVPIVNGKVGDIAVYGYIPRLPLGVRDGIYSDSVTVQVDF
jgi:spore coat protein U-like protein